MYHLLSLHLQRANFRDILSTERHTYTYLERVLSWELVNNW